MSGTAGGFYGVNLGGVRGKCAIDGINELAYFDDNDDAPELDGRDVDLLARRGQINLVTWLDD